MYQQVEAKHEDKQQVIRSGGVVQQQKQAGQIDDNRGGAVQLQQLSQGMGQSPLMQRQAEQQAQMMGGAVQRQVEVAPNRTGLPDGLKSGMESLSGMSLDHVRVHRNSSKPAAVQAHAYAQGSDIHLASGQEGHLPHELGHVVQQMQGRVQATTSVGGMAVNDNVGLESEATRMGEVALQRVYSGGMHDSRADTGVANLIKVPKKAHSIQRFTKVTYDTQPYRYVNAGGAVVALEVGSYMFAKIDANDTHRGTGTGAWGPMQPIMNDLTATHGGGFVKGHLLNANLSGAAMPHNLYPITDVANFDHSNTVEYKVKNAVYERFGAGWLGGFNEHVKYTVRVTTPTGNPASTRNAAIGPGTDTDANLLCRWNMRDMVAPHGWLGWQQRTINSRVVDRRSAIPLGSDWGVIGLNSRTAVGAVVNGALTLIAQAVVVGANPPVTRTGAPLPIAPTVVSEMLVEGRGAGAAPAIVGTYVGWIN